MDTLTDFEDQVIFLCYGGVYLDADHDAELLDAVAARAIERWEHERY